MYNYVDGRNELHEELQMDIYVARQPIFDRKMNIYGYELLYRKSFNNFYEGNNDNQATAELITNSLSIHFDVLTEGKWAFINFSKDMLDKEIPSLLPKDIVIIEILERVQGNDELLKICKKLKEKGYIIALDDFVFQDSYIPIVDEVDILKIEFGTVTMEMQKKLLAKYHNKVKFLAEKIETREEYQLAFSMGYDYFQGYFFSRPYIFKGSDLPVINGNLIRILQEYKNCNPDYDNMSAIIQTDLGLSYKLLKMANSVYFGARYKIDSIKNALVRLGLEEIKKWTYLMMLKENQKIENMELIKNSLIRAKMMEFLAIQQGLYHKRQEYFMTGLFSSIHVLLCRPMAKIVEELKFADEVKEALLGVDNELRRYLLLILSFENAQWDRFDQLKSNIQIELDNFMDMYIKTLEWLTLIEYE